MTDALKKLAKQEAVYAYCFEGKRYDVGDKLGFIQANIEYALKREDLRENLIKYLLSIKEKNNTVVNEELYYSFAGLLVK